MKISITAVKTVTLFFFFTLASTLVSHAATIIVTNLDDSGAGSLRQAIIDAGDGDDIDFSVSGTIPLESQIEIDKSLTINGGGNIILDGQSASRIFLVDDSTAANKVVSLTGLTFINGNFVDGDSDDGGGAIYNNEELSVDSCVFKDNSADHRSPSPTPHPTKKATAALFIMMRMAQ